MCLNSHLLQVEEGRCFHILLLCPGARFLPALLTTLSLSAQMSPEMATQEQVNILFPYFLSDCRPSAGTTPWLSTWRKDR